MWNRRVPGHEIAMYDSRLWDPNWEYRGQWRLLYNALRIFGPYENPHHAATLASQRSDWWGRGYGPGVRLRAALFERSPIDALKQWIRRLTDRDTFWDALADPVPIPSSRQ